ncbi:MAG: LPP20 family lipoprotein [Spirochaetaceae bacterium]|jgi:hypothetical protein|nr:LPP20 family lipoprotein [Spirochaetaceae bacterium]
MFKVNFSQKQTLGFAFLGFLVLSGCASSGASSESDAVAASDSAKPGWVDSPYSVYPESQYVAASSSGIDRNDAEKKALAALVAVFGQSVQADLRMISRYSEAVKNGVVQVSSENTEVQNAIKTSSEMESLIGAEIRDVWEDRRTYYAAAVLDREKASSLYTDMIASNQRIISDLTSMSDPEKYSLDGYSRYRLAGTIADVNRVYANVLTIVGKSSSVNPGNLKKGDDYRLEAANIAKAIPVAIQIDNDRADRIKSAFAGALAEQGFRTGGNNSRYVLRVKVNLNAAEYPNQSNKFTRYVIDANFVDTAENSVLFPFNINGREGHLTQTEAENRAVAAAEKAIAAQYPSLLADYLANLLPKK